MDKATQDYAATSEQLAASAGQFKLEADSDAPPAESSNPDKALRNDRSTTAVAVSEF
jgi:hypothetical protein